MRRPPRLIARTCGLLALACVTAGCVGPTGDQSTTTPSVSDPGAEARQAVLQRMDGRGAITLLTPDVVGLSVGEAARALRAAGLSITGGPADDGDAVHRQHPHAGAPAPPAGQVEVWTSVALASAVAAQPPPEADPPVPTATTPPGVSDPPAAEATSTPSYVLPPHTPGLLRVNPRRLPALPAGTELTGRASWYGPGFHGNTTACGEVYDQNAATLASRELRCGTVVRITGPSGLTVEARVNDWGPAEWAGRRFDLSAAVFNAIAPISQGVIDVRVVTVNVPR